MAASQALKRHANANKIVISFLGLINYYKSYIETQIKYDFIENSIQEFSTIKKTYKYFWKKYCNWFPFLRNGHKFKKEKTKNKKMMPNLNSQKSEDSIPFN